MKVLSWLSCCLILSRFTVAAVVQNQIQDSDREGSLHLHLGPLHLDVNGGGRNNRNHNHGHRNNQNNNNGRGNNNNNINNNNSRGNNHNNNNNARGNNNKNSNDRGGNDNQNNGRGGNNNQNNVRGNDPDDNDDQNNDRDGDRDDDHDNDGPQHFGLGTGFVPFGQTQPTADPAPGSRRPPPPTKRTFSFDQPERRSSLSARDDDTVEQAITTGSHLSSDNTDSPTGVRVLLSNDVEGWEIAYNKADETTQHLDLTTKVAFITGRGYGAGQCMGQNGGMHDVLDLTPHHPSYTTGRLPPLCLQPGTSGITGFVDNDTTFFPAGIHAAATWDRTLIVRQGIALGTEARQLGINVLSGPAVGPMGRTPYGGRSWESFGPDPFLSGECAASMVSGIQSTGVQAAVKNLIAGEQETNRYSVDTRMDDRTLHEIYLWPFAEAVRANVAAVVCDSGYFNGHIACESDELINKILKEELGFKGFVMSDWTGGVSTLGSVRGGMDLSIPGDSHINRKIIWGQRLLDQVGNGTVSECEIDDKVRRVLTSWYYLNQNSPDFPPIQFDMSRGTLLQSKRAIRRDHGRVASRVARDGTVLLKNEDKILPLANKRVMPNSVPSEEDLVDPSSSSHDGMTRLAIIGYDAFAYPESLLKNCFGHGCSNVTVTSGWGFGAPTTFDLVDPFTAISARVKADFSDQFSVLSSVTNDPQEGWNVMNNSDIGLVFINANSGQGYGGTPDAPTGDRTHLNPYFNGTELVQSVASLGKPVIVIIHSVGPVILEPIVDLPQVKAILWAGLPGQAVGDSISDILFGLVSPSGKLPFTIAKKEEDYNVSISSDCQVSDLSKQGLEIDYHHFAAHTIQPRYEFGFGLTYTEFSQVGLQARWVGIGESDVTLEHSMAGTDHSIPASGELGGHPALYDNVVAITFQIINSGPYPAANIAQLYITFPDSAKQPGPLLRGFLKTRVMKTYDTEDILMYVRMKDLAYWDSVMKRWRIASGKYKFTISESSDLKGPGGAELHVS